ncbi:MAG: hypothetical protein IH616_20680 [Gemmatimonadales bacterium]|nr:hypothetical protein [Gemmatimonadales bacterium]
MATFYGDDFFSHVVQSDDPRAVGIVEANEHRVAGLPLIDTKSVSGDVGSDLSFVDADGLRDDAAHRHRASVKAFFEPSSAPRRPRPLLHRIFVEPLAPL